MARSTFTVSQRLVIVSVLVGAGLLISGVMAFKTLEQVKVNGPLYREIVLGKDLIADILPPPEYIIESFLVVHQLKDEHDPAARDSLVLRLGQLEKDYDVRHKFWLGELQDGELKQTLTVDSYQPAKEFFTLVNSRFIPALNKDDVTEIGALVAGPLQDAYQRHRVAIDRSVELAVAYASATEARAGSVVRFSTWIIVGMTVLLMVAIGVAIGFMSRRLNVALTRLATALDQSSGQVSTAASQVADASRSLAQGANMQAGSLEESASALEEMSGMTRATAETARTAEQLSHKAKGLADDGSAAVVRMAGAIQEIESAANDTAKIVKTIDEIAFQTNLLALNAAVEAARAGDAGKGFAVVAEEVRSLATRSAQAARTTAELIEQSVTRARNGVIIANSVTTVLTELTSSSSRVTQLVKEISAASAEQATGIGQVNKAVASIDTITQQNAAASEESSAASETLSHQAVAMTELVGELRALVGVPPAGEAARANAVQETPKARPAYRAAA